MRTALGLLLAAAVALVSEAGPAKAQATWGDWLTASTYHTEHFRVLYQAAPDGEEAAAEGNLTTAAYAKAVGDYIEEARAKIFGELGFAEPWWLEGNKLDVYIVDIPIFEQGTGKPLGAAYQNLRRLDRLVGERVLFNPWIEIALERHVLGDSADEVWKEQKLKALVVHEFFHVVQFGYDVEERFWLMESTATWVEDKVFDPPPDYARLTGWAERFPEWTDFRTSMSTLSSERTNEYAASVFFQYLSERRPGKDDIVRRLWERAAQVDGHNTYQALAEVLGDAYPWGETMRARIGDFAVATLIQSPSLNPTFSFKKLDAAKQDYIDGLHPKVASSDELIMQGSALDRLNADRVVPVKRDLQPFQIGYYEIMPSTWMLAGISDVKQIENLGRLAVSVRGKSSRDWDFRLVEVPRREHEGDPIEQWTVRKFPGQRFREKWATLEIEDYPRNRLILVAVNTAAVDRDEEIGPNKTIKSLPADSFEVAAVMLTPPIVTSFSVEVDEAEGDEVQWRPVWKVVREPASRPGTWRTRTILNEGIRYDEQHDPEIRFRVLTSRPVLRPPTLYVDRKGLRLRPGAGSTAYWSPRRLEYRTAFETVVESSFFFDAAAKRLKRGENVVEVEVAVGGRDSWGGYVDGRPETPPGLSVQDDGSLQVTSWEGDFVLGGKIDRLSGRKLPVHMREPVSYLKTVVARQNGKEIYRAAWRPNDEREGARQLDVAVSETYDADADMEVSLRFSQPVLDVTVRLASGKQPDYREGYRVELPAPAELGADAYRFTIPPSEAVAKILKEDQRLGFLVDARTKDGPRIDANPRTAAWFDWDDKRWYGLEENIRYGGRTSDGGTDEWHRLNAAGRSIVLLLDASGSMKKAGRIAEAKQGISDAVAKLRAADEVALIAFFGCHDIRTLVAFTEDHDSVVKAVRNVKPSGDTPLGDAIRFANNYLERAARHKQRKLLVFSDGKTTCGDSAANAIAEVEAGAPEPEREQEDVPRELRWTVYRVGGDGSAYVPKYWVEAIEYRESDHEDDAKDQARLTIRRHPVSYVSSRGRTVWSINWSRTREQDRKEAQGARVPGLRSEAEALREGSMAKDRVHEAMRRLIGPGAVALGRAQ